MDSGHSPTLRRVLVVDDDQVSLSIAALLLESEGCTVVQAENGEQAIEIASFQPPDCILADLRMPGLSGTELALRLREAAPQAALLAMSASPPVTVEGYDGVLRKPLTPEALNQILASTTGRRREGPRSVSASADDQNQDGVLDLQVFDRLRRAISASALEEVISTFVSDTRARIHAMRSADPETLRREAHTVKGGAAMVGAVQVSEAAAAVESGIDDPGARSRKLDEMEDHTYRAEIILRQRLQA